MEFNLVNKSEAKAFAEQKDAIFCETSSKENAPGFSEFINNLIEKYTLKSKLVKNKTIILKEEDIKKEEIRGEKNNGKKNCC